MERRPLESYKEPKYPNKENFDIRKLYKKGRIGKKGLAALSVLAAMTAAGCAGKKGDGLPNTLTMEKLADFAHSVDDLYEANYFWLEGDVAYMPIAEEILADIKEQAADTDINLVECGMVKDYDGYSLAIDLADLSKGIGISFVDWDEMDDDWYNLEAHDLSRDVKIIDLDDGEQKLKVLLMYGDLDYDDSYNAFQNFLDCLRREGIIG